MTGLPAPVPGSAAIAHGDGLLAYDPGAGEICTLAPAAAAVWAACRDGLDEDDLVAELVGATGGAADALAEHVRRVVGELERGGLVSRRPAAPVEVWQRQRPEVDAPHQVRLRVLDEVVQVEVEHRWLLDEILRRCRDLRTDDPPTRWLVAREVDGQIRLDGPRTGWRSHDDLDALLGAVVAEVNVVVASWAGGLALHAGCARRPDGALVALAGASGAGKSTLVAALVRAGWDYVTDEATGVRSDGSVLGYPKPLSLDRTSRRLLGLVDPADAAAELDVPVGDLRPDVLALSGPVGPLTAFVVPHRRPDAGAVLEAIDDEDVLATVAAHAMNLGVAGRTGLEALVGVAERVPCLRLHHGSLDAAVAALDAVARRPALPPAI